MRTKKIEISDLLGVVKILWAQESLLKRCGKKCLKKAKKKLEEEKKSGPASFQAC